MTEKPDAVNEWLDELTTAEFDDVARILQRQAEDKRRQEWQDNEDTNETTYKASHLTFRVTPFPRAFLRRRR